MVLMQACSRVQVVPFKRPEVMARTTRSCNHVAFSGLLCKEVRRAKPDVPAAMSTMLVPLLPMPALHAQPSSTPCVLVCVDFWDDLADVALAHLAPGHHIFVSGSLGFLSYSETFRVRADVFRFVLDDSPPDRNIRPGTLQALATDGTSRWQAYFHSPTEWHDYRALKAKSSLFFPDFQHRYTGIRLRVSAISTPEWVKARLAQQHEISTPSHNILHGENLAP